MRHKHALFQWRVLPWPYEYIDCVLAWNSTAITKARLAIHVVKSQALPLPRVEPHADMICTRPLLDPLRRSPTRRQGILPGVDVLGKLMARRRCSRTWESSCCSDWCKSQAAVGSRLPSVLTKSCMIFSSIRGCILLAGS